MQKPLQSLLASLNNIDFNSLNVGDDYLSSITAQRVLILEMGFAAISDTKLIEASRSGDVQAFGRIVERYERLVCAVSFSATGDRALSEDVAQETFLNAWRGLGELRETTKLRAWLCGIARNLGHKALRRRDREVPSGLDLDVVEGACATARTSPLEATIDRESEQIVWDALRKMPETYREPLVLFHQQDRSAEQVANDLGLSTDAVKKRLNRGRQYLKENVAEIVERTLSQSRPSKNFVAVVIAAIAAGISVPAQADPSTSTASNKPTKTTTGEWTMFKKIGFGVAALAAASALGLSTFGGGDQDSHAEAAPGNDVGSVPSRELPFSAQPKDATLSEHERYANAAPLVPASATSRESSNSRDWVQKYRIDGHPGTIEQAVVNGLGECFGLAPRGKRSRQPQFDKLPADRFANEKITIIEDVLVAPGAPTPGIEPFAVELELSLRAGAPTAAAFVGDQPFGNGGANIEACVLRAFNGVEFTPESNPHMYFAVEPKQDAPPPDQELYAALAIADGPSRGNKAAPITAVAFVDFRCRYSSRLLGTLDQLMEEYDGKMRLVVKQFPVNAGSDIAAEAALAAGSQGKFWEMHDALFANQDVGAEPDYSRLAVDIGLNAAQFKSDMAEHTFAEAVRADQDEGYSMGIKGTPTLLINGQRLSGDRPIESYRSVINDALKVVSKK